MQRTLPLSVVATCLATFALGSALGLGTACTTGTGDEAECAAASDCGGTSAPCDDCPAEADALCLAGACEDRSDDATTVTAGILRIEPRTLDVPSLVHILVDATGPSGAFSCADATTDPLPANVLRSGFKNLSGGSQHMDVTFGRVPEGKVTLIVLGKSESSGGGNVIASLCEADIDATGETVTLELLTLQGS